MVSLSSIIFIYCIMNAIKSTVNPINKKDKKCIQYAVIVALNHEEVGKYPERITKIKSFIYKYN